MANKSLRCHHFLFWALKILLCLSSSKANDIFHFFCWLMHTVLRWLFGLDHDQGMPEVIVANIDD